LADVATVGKPLKGISPGFNVEAAVAAGVEAFALAVGVAVFAAAPLLLLATFASFDPQPTAASNRHEAKSMGDLIFIYLLNLN
jgi:hypothetical protein